MIGHFGNVLWHLQVGLRDFVNAWGQFARWVATRGEYEPWSES